MSTVRITEAAKRAWLSSDSAESFANWLYYQQRSLGLFWGGVAQ